MSNPAPVDPTQDARELITFMGDMSIFGGKLKHDGLMTSAGFADIIAEATDKTIIQDAEAAFNGITAIPSEIKSFGAIEDAKIVTALYAEFNRVKSALYPTPPAV